jgi:hypothetical protein
MNLITPQATVDLKNLYTLVSDRQTQRCSNINVAELTILLHLIKENSLAILSRIASFKMLHGDAKLVGPESKNNLWDTSLSSLVDRYRHFREI